MGPILIGESDDAYEVPAAAVSESTTASRGVVRVPAVPPGALPVPLLPVVLVLPSTDFPVQKTLTNGQLACRLEILFSLGMS